MSFFTWKDKGLTSDCASLDAMASRFEESANLMKKLSKKGYNNLDHSYLFKEKTIKKMF